MTNCYDKYPYKAIELLCVKDRLWSHKSLIEIAAFAKNRTFIAHPSCQKYLDNVFMGNIEIRDLPYGDFTIPLWMKIILCNFLIFPVYLWIKFETKEAGDYSKANNLENPLNNRVDSSKSLSNLSVKNHF
ncbi:protein ced-11 [Caerostris extrusa]|uniref:Protein ced-11 n=1 Tax=Caerostris extrusa TaxID=172846 RepID=A0AAV4VWZ7_CAEEX|nr:protein ced-11 [Caerostris extrusa]